MMSCSCQHSRSRCVLSLYTVAILLAGGSVSCVRGQGYVNVTYDNYDYDYDNYYDYEEGTIDHCNFYDSEHAEECRHAQFPSATLQEMFNDRIRTCCPNHGYLFHDNCQTREHTYQKKVCAQPHTSSGNPVLRTKSVHCPGNCQVLELERTDFDILEGGALVTKLNGTSVSDYCLAYHCTGDYPRRWGVTAETCVCHDYEAVKLTAEGLLGPVEKCCPDTLQVAHPKNSQEIMCPITDSRLRLERESERRFCQGEWIRVPEKDLKLRHENGVNLTDFKIGSVAVVGKRLDSLKLCGGVKYGVEASYKLSAEPFERVYLYCHEQKCMGKEPCVRTCCGPNEMFRTCKAMSASQQQKYLQLEMFRSLSAHNNLTEANLEKASERSRGSCPRGFKVGGLLRPSQRCNDRFGLEKNSAGEVELRTVTDQVRTDFCLYFEEGGSFSAEICVEDEHVMKFKFYPYILLTSSVALLLTLIVYTAYPKLLNNYTRLMRHFIVNMFWAFVILSVNQLVSLAEVSLIVCQVSAFLLQYFLLAGFHFMTIMSVEISMLMSGSRSSKKRYRWQMVCGYVVPISLSLITGLVEALAPKCSPIRPRFGEEQCFFTDAWSKLLWFFVPIAVMLLVNACMFAGSVKALVNVERQKRRLHVMEPQKRSEKMDKFLIYLKLFVGMGFIWVFEIAAGLISSKEYFWYVSDFLNMGQGVFIFVVFVCKRNVMNVVFGQNTPQGKVLNRVRRSISGAGKGQKLNNLEAQRSIGKASSTQGTVLPMASFKETSNAHSEG